MPSALYDQQRREYQELLEDYREISRENLALRQAITRIYHLLRRDHLIAFKDVELLIKGDWLEC